MSGNNIVDYTPTGSHDHHQIQFLKDHISNPNYGAPVFAFSAAEGRDVLIETPRTPIAKFLLFPNDLYPNDGTKGPYKIGSLLVTKRDNDGKPKEWIYRAKLSIDGSPDDPQTTNKYLFPQAVEILITNRNLSSDYSRSNINFLEKQLQKNNDYPMNLFTTETLWALIHQAKDDYNASINVGLNQVLHNQESLHDRLIRISIAFQGALITLGLQSTAIDDVRDKTEQIIDMQRRLPQLEANEMRKNDRIPNDDEAGIDNNYHNKDNNVSGGAGISNNNLQQEEEMAAGVPVPESTNFGSTNNKNGDDDHANGEDFDGGEGYVEVDDGEIPGLIGPDAMDTNTTTTIRHLEKKAVEFARSLVQDFRDEHAKEIQALNDQHHSQELESLKRKHQEDLEKQRQELETYHSKLIEAKLREQEQQWKEINQEKKEFVTIKMNELKAQYEQEQEELKKIKLELDQTQIELDAENARSATLEQLLLIRSTSSGAAAAAITTGDGEEGDEGQEEKKQDSASVSNIVDGGD